MLQVPWTIRSFLPSPSWWWGTAASVILHAGAMIALALWMFGTPGGGSAIAIDADWMTEADVPLAEVIGDVTVVQEQLPQPTQGGAAGEAILRSDKPLAMVLPESLASTSQQTSSDSHGSQGSQGTGAGDAFGEGLQAEGQGGFFGSPITEGSYVFVVDCSKSMNHRYPGKANTRFGRVRLELFRAIGSMSAEQQFYIIFFHSDAIPMSAEELVPATQENKVAYLGWVNSVTPRGRTNPYDALMQGLRLNPDVLYFLTDGDFPEAIADRVTRRNLRKTTIHTIGFGEIASAAVLESMAADNNGTCKLIIPHEDDYDIASSE